MQEARTIPQGARALKPNRAAEKYGRKKSWFWAKVKSDPNFPRPIYLAPKAPVFIESEIDAHLAKLAAAPIAESQSERMQGLAARRKQRLAANAGG